MQATRVLLELAGNVVLLLWGLHMVQSGLTRALGGDLRRILGAGLRNRWTAFLSGMGITMLLQSSTATGLMATGFTATGLVSLMPALAVMLGANVGSTLIVQILAFDVAHVAPVLLLGGFIAFRRGARTRSRDLGRVAIGLGLMLLSLHLLLATIAPAENAPMLRRMLAMLTADPVVAVMLAALLSWAAHSSVAAILLIASLAGGGVIGPEAAVAMVAGANLGSAVNPVIEGPGGDGRNPAARRLPVGNLINRLVGCVIVVPLLGPITAGLQAVSPDATRLAANFHLAFNLAMAGLFIGPLPWFARLLTRMFPERVAVADPAMPLYLDRSALRVPHLAVANASREALRMADTVDSMLRGALDVIQTDDRKRVQEIRRMDDVLDRLHDAIKRYLTQINVEDLDERDARRVSDVLTFTINLEHVGDIVDRNLMEAASKKIRRRLRFSTEGAAEIAGMLERLSETQRLAAAVFVSGDVRSARALIHEKEVIRDLETSATEAHFARLRAGRKESVETSALHLDILRDLRRINAHLVAAAYPVLDQSGELLPSRLKRGAARA
ncbi:Na/Pi cotransporter family protein [Azospirillum oryzae]|uniref:Na/Pi cotransporter family protein n=1 Tax=Azospirillum oryzae TaxID=286727 RepID=A0A6N1AIU5_9PROT|nr:Na/Pi cotransporter family protein [Azospirillum oryzae]KAA0589815.1 Na/Pi cotransporter family protein [Azospirillum oryzae]QKS51651.1 Na/Pi cotransporter family protein [Azospirillum oryzae]GLR81652.1 Na/Pi cotransporter [Azospirillum oryzae]